MSIPSSPAALSTAKSAPLSHSQQIFSKLDHDSDGLVSFEEYLAGGQDLPLKGNDQAKESSSSTSRDWMDELSPENQSLVRGIANMFLEMQNCMRQLEAVKSWNSPAALNIQPSTPAVDPAQLSEGNPAVPSNPVEPESMSNSWRDGVPSRNVPPPHVLASSMLMEELWKTPDTA